MLSYLELVIRNDIFKNRVELLDGVLEIVEPLLTYRTYYNILRLYEVYVEKDLIEILSKRRVLNFIV